MNLQVTKGSLCVFIKIENEFSEVLKIDAALVQLSRSKMQNIKIEMLFDFFENSVAHGSWNLFQTAPYKILCVYLFNCSAYSYFIHKQQNQTNRNEHLKSTVFVEVLPRRVKS